MANFAPCCGAPATSSDVRYVVAAAAVIIGATGVVALRDATLSTHQTVRPDSRIELVVRVRTHGAERGQTVTEATEALLLACRLEVNSDPAGPIEDLGEGRFRAVLRPSMDSTDRRQFRGCLEDWNVDHVLVDVVRLADLES
jgi:hypothetical protein